MRTSHYGFTVETGLGFDESVTALRAALVGEGFGVLTEIDLRKTLKEKLDIERGDYMILGACNPRLARRALESEAEVGLLLPCNVIVREDDGKVSVSVLRAHGDRIARSAWTRGGVSTSRDGLQYLGR